MPLLRLLTPDSSRRHHIIKELEITVSLLLGMCLLEPSHQQHNIGVHLAQEWCLETLVDLLNLPESDRACSKLHRPTLDLVYAIIVFSPSSIQDFIKAGVTEALEHLVKSKSPLIGQVAYELTTFIALGVMPSVGAAADSESNAGSSSFESAATSSSISHCTDVLKTPTTPVTPNVEAITICDSTGGLIDGTEPSLPSTPKRKRDRRVVPATTHSSSRPSVDATMPPPPLPATPSITRMHRSATSVDLNTSVPGYYTPQARGEKRRNLVRSDRNLPTSTSHHTSLSSAVNSSGSLAASLGVVKEESHVSSPRHATNLARRGSLLETPFGSDLDETMHSTIKAASPFVLGASAVNSSTTTGPHGQGRLVKSRSTMGPGIASSSSSSRRLATTADRIETPRFSAPRSHTRMNSLSSMASSSDDTQGLPADLYDGLPRETRQNLASSRSGLGMGRRGGEKIDFGHRSSSGSSYESRSTGVSRSGSRMKKSSTSVGLNLAAEARQ